MKIKEKEKITRKNNLYSAKVDISSDDEQKEASVLFNISDEYLRFKTISKDINILWSDDEIIKILKPREREIFERKKTEINLI
jgi:hypothetical protein